MQLTARTGDQVSAFVTKRSSELLRGKLYLTEGFEALSPTNRYELLRAKVGAHLIIVYSTGKVVYDRSEIIRRIIEESVYEVVKEEGTVLGSDEAGKGELIGPMVASAVCTTPRQAARLVSWGIADSKVVPVSRIRELAGLVMNESLGYHSVSIPPLRFNSLFEKVKKQGRNLNDILADAHSEVIRSVLSRVQAPAIRIVVDQFDSTKGQRQLKVIGCVSDGRRVESTPRAEIVPAVAAASVLARHEYLGWVEENLDEGQLERLRKGDVNIAKRAEDIPRLYKIAYLEVLERTRARRTKDRRR